MSVPLIPASHPHLASLQNLARRLRSGKKFRKQAQPLRHIAAVGVAYDAKTGFSRRDLQWLKQVLKLCASLGVPVPLDFTVMPLDITKSQEQDFLNPELKLPAPADIVAVCYIVDKIKSAIALQEYIGFAPKMTKQDIATTWKAFEQRFASDPKFITSLWESETAWPDAVRRSGARLVVTFSEQMEIDGRDFIGEGFTLLASRSIMIWGRGFLPEDYILDAVAREDWAIQAGFITPAAASPHSQSSSDS